MQHVIADATESSEQITLARRLVYQFLSLALSDPHSARWQRLSDEDFLGAADEAAGVLRLAMRDQYCYDEAVALAPGEQAPRRLNPRSVLRFLGDAGFDARREHQRVFGLMMSKSCPPYESEYCRQTFSVYRSQQIADVAGFYRAFGLEPSRDMPERADHVALELEFMAWLIAKEQQAVHAGQTEHAAIARDAQQRFLTDHLAWWVPAFAAALHARAQADDAQTFYGAIAMNLAAFIFVERTILVVPPPTELLPPREDDQTDPADCDQCPLAAAV